MPYVPPFATSRCAARTRAASLRSRGAAASAAISLAAIALALGGCGSGTEHPGPISARELSEAQTFPYYRVYWAGPQFGGDHVTAADGLRGYIERVGTSVYYGDCVKSKGIFGGGSCVLPLQVTTVIYRLHSNVALGAQRNTVVRGVPAVVYDKGHSIELYTGRESIDIFSDSLAHALAAAQQLKPINAPGSARGSLPAPVFCPGLSGPVKGRVAAVMASLANNVCRNRPTSEA